MRAAVLIQRSLSAIINRTFESFLRRLGIYRPSRVQAPTIMEEIENVRLVECKNSQYVKPTRMLFKQNGHERVWDLMKTHDSVAAVLHNTSRNVLLFVRQFRPAVYFGRIPAEEFAKSASIDTTKYPGSLGLTLELCAGIIDKSSMSPEETMQQEILEECGYNVPLSRIQKITSFRSGVGILGARQDLFFAEVTDDMRQTAGGGCAQEGEMIHVVELTIPEARKMLTDETIMRPSALLFGVVWFLELKPKLKAWVCINLTT